MNDDDTELVAAIRDGSERAFNILIDRHQQAVRAFLRCVMGSAAEADDLAQDTFLAAWTQIRSFRGETSVRSWLNGDRLAQGEGRTAVVGAASSARRRASRTDVPARVDRYAD